MNKQYKVTELQLDSFKDLIDSYLKLLEQIKEEDEFMDNLRQSRIMDCESALIEIKSIRG